MSETKKIKIIKIMDETAFVINAGSDDNIKENDQFEIIDLEGEQVIDPDTNEVLGKLNTSKGKIIAKTVYPKMTIAETRKIGGKSNYLNNIMKMTSPILMDIEPSHPEELLVDESQISGGFQKSSNPIKIGDEVIKL